MFTNFSQMSTAFLNATGDARNKYEIQNAVGEADKLRPNLSEADIDRICRATMTDAQVIDFYNAFLSN